MTLMILAHPTMEQSIANKTISEAIKTSMPEVEIRNIHQLYPDYRIDVAQEQQALLRHDLIVLQYPMYWFNMPAILKIWFDGVFTYQFAYGSKGDKLKGKKLLASLTIGQPEQNFQQHGHNTMDNLLQPVKQSAQYAQMQYMEPIMLYGISSALGHAKQEVQQKALAHSQKLAQILKGN